MPEYLYLVSDHFRSLVQGILFSASQLAQKSTYVMVIIFHDNAPLSYWNPVPIHDSYETIRSS